MADRISDRRLTSNNYFLALNTAIIGFVGYLRIAPAPHFDLFKSRYWLISLTGILLCYIWYRIIRSYKDLNSGKFQVVHQIERLLPIRPFDAEWTAVGRGEDPKKYLPFTHLETKVPLIFLAFHIVVILLFFLFK